VHIPDLSSLAPLLNDISLQAPWALIERFAGLAREHPDDVRRAGFEIVGRLAALGVPVTMEEPELFLSLPRRASISTRDKTVSARALAMSRSLPAGLNAPLIFAPEVDATPHAAGQPGSDLDVAGKFVLTHGFASHGVVRHFERQGAAGVIAISPGRLRHAENCSSVWGSPDLHSLALKPGIQAVSVSHADGLALIERARAGEYVSLFTELEEGWFPSPIPLVRIAGTEEPGPFVLLHGHYDAWGVGVGDNATGSAALLEIARVLWAHRDRLKRSVWVAWWPGHATGGNAGSAWFADRYAVDLYERCIAQVSCMSPGCRSATAYEQVPVMAEAEGWARAVIRTVTGTEATIVRPSRAGDYSFDNIGISGVFMTLSTIPAEERTARGYYPVGGGGGNIAWHTEADTLEIADRAVLLADMKVYLAAVAGAANAVIVPFDFAGTMDELTGALTRYQQAATGLVSFEPALAEVSALRHRLERFAQHTDALQKRPVSDPAVRRANAALRRLARLLVPVGFTSGPAFFHDPAEPVGPIPDLAPALAAPRMSVHHRGFLRTHLVRGQNRLVAALRDAAAVVRGAMA
jgi:N-acetylated-alpha-linked acidic dipeptidase